MDELTGEVLHQFARFWKLKDSTSRRYSLQEAFEWCRKNEIDRVLDDTGLNAVIPIESAYHFY
ncbi:hypothetical protein WD019_19000 [Fictibacillus sp. Mic-4]|uniref:hypothetical protein n=1 Tax=Fictibacillus sp. Mic-4 TaxID=3132826 RepID=UPI003CEA403F